MKVIDLINMINNEEKLPKKMIINKRTFHSNVYGFMIYEEDCNTDIWMSLNLMHINLNDEVEITVEEQNIDIQPIKELLAIEEYEVDKTDVVLNRNKINEIIKVVKQIDREINREKE